MMYIQRHSKEWLTPARLDTDHYNPEAINAIKKIQITGKYESFGSSGSTWGFGAYELCNQIEEDESPNSPGFIKIGDISPPFIDESTVMGVSLSTHRVLDIAHVKTGDILVSIAGTIGASAIIPESKRNYSANQAIVKHRTNNKIFYNYYLVAYTLSRHFQLIIAREAGGAVQKNLYLYNFDTIPIPNTHALVQKYIGDKVRQAERLRAWANVLESAFSNALKEEFPKAFTNKTTARKYSWAKNDEIIYTLNPGAFNEERLRIQRYLFAHDGKRINTIATISGSTSSDYTSNTPYIGLDAISSNSCQLKPSTIEESEILGNSRVLSEGPVISKLRPYLNKVSYIPSWLNGSVGSTELLCVQPKGDISAWYLYGVLKSEPTLKQLEPLASGATHPRIDQYDIYNLVVPISKEQDKLGKILSSAQKCYFHSTYLTKSAKYMIEALIESNLTETQIIQVQQALESGDNTLDRQILSRLKTDGFDGNGEPLFPDLDQLYDLLNQAEEALSS